ncbi:MAG: hypothetical protein EPN93_05215 [Spirochaetes bacterium]|nr:MAG: hypothetical protein EPN93_05215 [Spirochaetota bacterium]
MKIKKLIMFVIIMAGIPAWESIVHAVRVEDPVERSPFRVTIGMDRFVFTEDEPVTVNIVIRNNSDKKESFRVYDTSGHTNAYTTFQPVVMDSGGREAETTVPHRLMNRNFDEVVRDLDPRELTLMPNETMVHTINLKTLYSLDMDIEYRVKGYFYPDARDQAVLMSENTLTFKIVRSPGRERKSVIAGIKRELAPSEVVVLLLSAERENNWNNFFKYLRAEKFINAYPQFVQMYTNADEMEKLKIIEDFNKFLMRPRTDYIKEFRVLRESIEDDKSAAYVDVQVKRYAPRKPISYTYRYTLEKFRDFWLCTDIEATVNKGESR